MDVYAEISDFPEPCRGFDGLTNPLMLPQGIYRRIRECEVRQDTVERMTAVVGSMATPTLLPK